MSLNSRSISKEVIILYKIINVTVPHITQELLSLSIYNCNCTSLVLPEQLQSIGNSLVPKYTTEMFLAFKTVEGKDK